LYKIWGFHSSYYGDPGLLGHDVEPTHQTTQHHIPEELNPEHKLYCEVHHWF